MKKYKVITLLVIIVTIISGCTIQADENKDVTYPVLEEVATRSIEPSRFDTETIYEDLEEPSVVERQATHVEPGGATWIYAKTQDGVRGTRAIKYKLTYNIKDELISRIEIPEAEEVNNTQPTVYQGGQVAQPGAYFKANRITRYGVDCVGCNMNDQGQGGTSAGVGLGLDSVRQKDGSWKKGLTYEGYYVVATSASIPLCTTLEIKNHSLNLPGVGKGEPIKAIVLDRGSAIQGAKMDFFVGSEKSPLIGGSNAGADVSILGLNSRVKINGQGNCAI